MGQSVRDALAVAVQVGQPVLLWGGPGEGKSKMIEQVAAQLGRPCEVVVGSVREASDFVGLPVRVGDSVSFAPACWATLLRRAARHGRVPRRSHSRLRRRSKRRCCGWCWRA